MTATPGPAWTCARRGVIVNVRLQPRASRRGVLGLAGDALRVAVREPAVEGAANNSLLALLAEALGVPRSTCTMLSGQRTRTKRILVDSDNPQIVVRALHAMAGRLDKKWGDD